MRTMNVIDYGQYDALEKRQLLSPTQTTVACGCIGPQNGQPRCPCQMRGIIERNGRWIQIEVDLGPSKGVAQ